jgi:aminopeptidase N
VKPGRVLTAAVGALSLVACSAGSSGGSAMPARSSGQVTAHRPATTVSALRRDPYYPKIGTTSVDALHYGLDLTWNASSHRLAGVATITFRAPASETSFALDLDHVLKVSAVRVDGTVSQFHHVGHVLRVETKSLARNTDHTVVVDYAGVPKPFPAPTTRKDIPDLGWTTTSSGQVWTMQEPYGALTWYPVNDQPSDKASYDITVHNKSAWTAVANGNLVSNTVSAGERTMHWRLGVPCSSYLVTIAIGPYVAHHDTGPRGLPLTYWVRPSDDASLATLRESPTMLRWLEKRLGRFPFSSAGVVVVPSTSGMETETMITIGAQPLRGANGQDNLLHEFSHQWYGDEVTPNNWKDLWLNESFATYFQLQWEIHHHQGTLAQWIATLNHYDQQLRDKYGPPGEYDRRNFAELNVYYCGARMLFRLKSMLGAKVFGAVLRGWPLSRRFGNADRHDWISYLDKTAHRNLRPFVTHWLDAKISPA